MSFEIWVNTYFFFWKGLFRKIGSRTNKGYTFEQLREKFGKV